VSDSVTGAVFDQLALILSSLDDYQTLVQV